MPESIVLTSQSAEFTAKIGAFLVQSLYAPSVNIALHGEMGAGKTTFVQGFAKALGIDDPVVSPTYALEQRYDDRLLHTDLFRLDQKEAIHRMHELEEFPGIKMIEWPPQHDDLSDRADIDVMIDEIDATTRSIQIDFGDVQIPDEKLIESWRKEVMQPEHIIKHSDVVTEVAGRTAKHLIQHGRPVRIEALKAAAAVHDLLRFVDFKEAYPEETKAVWDAFKAQYGTSHEQAATQFLIEHGFPEIGMIVRTHGAPHTDEAIPKTIEQKILHYSDKRALHDRIVTVEERFEDFVMRYGKGQRSPLSKRWFDLAKDLERELFPNGVPF